MEEGLTLGGDHVTTLQFGFLRCHLPDLRAADYAHSANIAVRILTALMDYPSTPEARVRVYGQAWQGLLELEQDPDQLVKYLGIIHTYLKLDTTEQQLYARLYPQEKRHMNQLAESWIEQGWHKGLQEGRQEGLLDGRQQTLAELLTERFGPLDEAVTRRLASASLDELKHWSRRILSAQTLDEVFQLQQGGYDRAFHGLLRPRAASIPPGGRCDNPACNCHTTRRSRSSPAAQRPLPFRRWRLCGFFMPAPAVTILRRLPMPRPMRLWQRPVA